MTVLLSLLVLVAAVWVTSVVIPGFEVKGLGGAVVTAVVFGVLNWLLGKLLFVLLGLGTLGLGFLLAFVTRWVVDAILLKLTDAVTTRVNIKSFGTALLAALSMSLLGSAAEWLIHSIGL